MGSHVGQRRIYKNAMNPSCDEEYLYDTLFEKSVSNSVINDNKMKRLQGFQIFFQIHFKQWNSKTMIYSQRNWTIIR